MDGLGLVEAFDDVEEAALVIAFVFGDPEPAHDLQPLGGIVVQRVMFHDRRAEHQELRLIPAAHDVEREAPIGDVIDGGGLFGRHDRMDRRHMRRRKDGHLPCGRP